jgi:Tfp pilus assembly PilM family ATPase
MALFTSRRPSSILGLTLEGRQLEGLVLSRANGSYKIARTFRASLSLDPLTDDPELVGREIRNRLEEARIGERRCVVGIPLPWVLTLHSKLPAIPEADLAGFLQLEAERGRPGGPVHRDIPLRLIPGRATRLAGGGSKKSLVSSWKGIKISTAETG